MVEEDPDEEDPDETYNEDEVYALPLDEDIQTSAPPAHQEENMMSYNPLRNLMMPCSMTMEIKKTAKRILIKFLLQKA
jgi:hypothetical protein